MQRVLYITNQCPFPPKSGGQLREARLIEALGKDFEIKLCILSTNHSADRCNGECAASGHVSEIHIVEAEEADSFRPACLSEEFSALCASVGQDCDLVHVEGYFLFDYVPEWLVGRSVMVAENVEYVLAPPDLKEIVRAKELKVLQAARCVVALSEEDRTLIAELSGRSAGMVPNGFDPPSASSLWRSGGNKVAYVANYDWGPSRDGASFLLSDVWPLVTSRFAGAELLLVGAGDSSSLWGLVPPGANVHFTGYVASLDDVFREVTVFVSPLRVGGGMKVKIMEAFSRGLPVVASDLSLAGFNNSCRRAALIASTKEEFASEVISVLESVELQRRLSLASLAAAREMPSWNDCAAELAYWWRYAANE